MTDKTEAMDNLIAQDADLIEICPDDLVQRLRVGDYYPDGDIGYHEISPGKVDALCEQAADRIEAQAAEIERLNKSAECLAESRRLAVKDLAVLEGHMRLETGQWKVDYDCAIRDIEHLRERIEAQAAEIEQWRECALYDATMEGPVFKGWDRSALERCRRAALDARGLEIRSKNDA